MSWCESFHDVFVEQDDIDKFSEVFVQWFRYIFLNLNRSVERKKEDDETHQTIVGALV